MTHTLREAVDATFQLARPVLQLFAVLDGGLQAVVNFLQACIHLAHVVHEGAVRPHLVAGLFFEGRNRTQQLCIAGFDLVQALSQFGHA